MLCHNCGGETRVIYTKPHPAGFTRRVRQCVACSRKFNTATRPGEAEILMANGAIITRTPAELAGVAQNYYQLVATFSRANLPPEWERLFHGALVNTKSRLGIQGGKHGLNHHRNDPPVGPRKE